MKIKDLICIILILIIAALVWQSGILEPLFAGAVRPVIQEAPTPQPAAQPIIIIIPERSTMTPEPTAVPVRIQSNEIESHGHSSTGGGCVTKDTPLGRVTSCVSKEGD